MEYLWMGRSRRAMWYSRLQGGSPRLCRLRTVHSGTLSKYLNWTDHMMTFLDLVNRRSSIIVVVGWYPTIHLEIFNGIVFTCHPRIAQCEVSHGRRALGRGGIQIDPLMSLQKVAIRGLSAGACMLCWSGFPPVVLYIDSDLRDTLRYEW
jgi:hypothetical protein